MKINAKKTSTIVAIIALLIAVTITLSLSLTGVNKRLVASKEATLNMNLSKAKVDVEDYKLDYASRKFNFNDSAFKKTEIVKKYINPKSNSAEIEDLAKNLNLEEIIITDIEGKYIAAYPKSLVGASVEDNRDMRYIKRILNNTTVKCVTEPKQLKDEKGIYEYYCAMARIENNELVGAVIIKERTTQYDEVLGSDIINKCSDGTIIARNDEVIGSTFTGLHTISASDINIKQVELDKEFTVSKNGNEYVCKALKVGDFTILSCIPATNFTITDKDMQIFFISAVIGLLIGAVIVCVSFKPRKKANN